MIMWEILSALMWVDILYFMCVHLVYQVSKKATPKQQNKPTKKQTPAYYKLYHNFQLITLILGDIIVKTLNDTYTH